MNGQEFLKDDVDIITVKITAVESFCMTLGLKMDIDGRKIAQLVEDLYTRFPEDWHDKLDDIMIQAHSLKDKSPKEASVYLGDVITTMELRNIKTKYQNNPNQMQKDMALTQEFKSMIQIQIKENDMRVAGIATSEFEPDWWTNYDIAQGKYDDTVRRYLGATQKQFGAIIDNNS